MEKETRRVWVKRELDEDGVTKAIHSISENAINFAELLTVPVECGFDTEKVRIYLNRKWLKENHA